MTDHLQFVCVSHQPEMYQRYVGGNPHVNRHALHLYDNRIENIGVSARYNQFIEEELPSIGDAWIIFLHHDFSFDEDPAPMLGKLPRDAIYGVVGARMEPATPYLQLKLRGDGRGLSLARTQVSRSVGYVKCSFEYHRVHQVGTPVARPELADTVDCCCVIAHSSLIRRFDLRFDPRLPWHLYSEDFSLVARHRHGIKTWVAPFESGHYGAGQTGADFYASLDYLLEKHGSHSFSSSCYSPPRRARWRTSLRHGFHFPLPSFFLRFTP